MSNKMDSRQVVQRSVQAMIGSAADEQLNVLIPKVNDELAKLFEDRNLLLVGGGDVAVNGAATSVTFSAALALHLNSKVAGGAPTVIDLAATTRAFSADGRMLYAVIDRSLGTATVTADSATLPAVTSANQEVVLIAKRVGTDIIFRDGTKIPAGRTVKLGSNDIFGSMGATDNKLVRTDGTDGKTVQGTGITVDDSDNLSTPGTMYSGASSIHASAAMQFDSTLKGALVPRMTTTEQNAIASPATGLLIFNTTTNAFHYYNGATWQAVGTSAGITTQAVLSTGSWVVPAGVSKLMCLVVGSGGGGSGGGNSGTGPTTHGGGGGGGGGGTLIFLPVSVTPGETLTVSLGAGGAAGAAGPTSGNGGAGNYSTISGTFGTLRSRGGNGGTGNTTNVGGIGAGSSTTVTGTNSMGGNGGNGGIVGVTGGTAGATGEFSAMAFGGAGGTPSGGASGGGGGGSLSNGGQGGNGGAEGSGAGLTAGAAGANGSGGGGGGGGVFGFALGAAGGAGGAGFISVWY